MAGGQWAFHKMPESRRRRDYVFTLNNYTPEDEEYLKTVECKYLTYGREVGENGTPHLQGYIRWDDKKSFRYTKDMLGQRYHIEWRKGTCDQAIAYCHKDGDIVEYGKKPMSQTEKGETQKRKWREIIKWSEDGETKKLKEEYPNIYFLHQEKIRRLNAIKPEMLQGDLINEWHYGKPGCGKSYTCQTKYPDAYRKNINKWWDNYEDEETVIIEEWEPSSNRLLQHLKIWADRYPFRAEMKGSSRVIRPKRVVITSNYTIGECCGGDKALEDALKRRFRVVYYAYENPLGYEVEFVRPVNA